MHKKAAHFVPLFYAPDFWTFCPEDIFRKISIKIKPQALFLHLL